MLLKLLKVSEIVPKTILRMMSKASFTEFLQFESAALNQSEIFWNKSQLFFLKQ